MFSQKTVGVSGERELIFDKVEVFFANKPVPIRSGLSVDLEIIRGIFFKKILRGRLERGLISKNLKGFFVKRPRLVRSGPSARPI